MTVIEREMGYSVAEFNRTLPLAMRDWQLSGGPHEWVVADAAGTPVAHIAIAARPDRRIGALSLPVLGVSIDLSNSAVSAEAFLLRFDRGFHKGGG